MYVHVCNVFLNVSDYLYRVGAVNSAGSAFSGWTVAMTQESGECT